MTPEPVCFSELPAQLQAQMTASLRRTQDISTLRFRFLDLPQELQNRIYEYCVADAGRYHDENSVSILAYNAIAFITVFT